MAPDPSLDTTPHAPDQGRQPAQPARAGTGAKGGSPKAGRPSADARPAGGAAKRPTPAGASTGQPPSASQPAQPSSGGQPTQPPNGGEPADGAQDARASIGRRLAALFLDWIMCLLIASLFADPRREALIPSLVLILEYTFFVGFFAQTPGMRLAKIRCVSVLPGREGHPIGAPRAALRGLLLALAIPALIMDPSQRGLHDKAAASQMVRA